jgi:hypothetical protein
MTDTHRYSVDSAREAAARDELDTWVADFLASPGSDNAPLGEELAEQTRCWLGPVLVPVDRLHRLAGPAEHPVLCPVDEDYWRDDVDDLEQKVREGWEPPPVIASFRDGQIVLEDGNHRVEGVRRTGADEVWTVIGFDSEADRAAFDVPA